MTDYIGTPGDDVINASQLNIPPFTTIFGRAGNDRIVIGDHNAMGEEGNDTIEGTPNSNSSAIYWNSPQGVNANLATGQAADGYGTTDRLINIRNLHGSSHADVLTGDGADNTFFPIGGSDTIDGGGGFDTINFFGSSAVRVNLATSQVTYVNSGAVVSFSNVERIVGSQAADTFIGTQGNDRFNIADVSSGNDTIDGGAGDDTVFLDAAWHEVEIVRRADGSTLVRDLRAGDLNKGDKVLVNIERIVAQDETGFYRTSATPAFTFAETRMGSPYTYAGTSYPAGPLGITMNLAGFGDFNGDGAVDVIMTRTIGYFAPEQRPELPILLFGNGGGGFRDGGGEVAGGMTAMWNARRIEVADFNRDGIDDVFIAGHDAGAYRGDYMQLLLGGRNGLTNATSNLPDLDATNGSGDRHQAFVHAMDAADIDGDGDIDIVVGATPINTPQGMFTLRNDGSARFTYETANLPAAFQGTHPLVVDLHLADLTGDGRPELIVGFGHDRTTGHTVRIYTNDGTGNFGSGRTFDLTGLPYGSTNSILLDTESADIDGDGDKDLILLFTRLEPYYIGRSVQIWVNDGSGNLTNETAARLSLVRNPANDGSAGLFLNMVDFNGDGHLDIYDVGNGSGSAPIIYLNDGMGRFKELPLTDIVDFVRGNAGNAFIASPFLAQIDRTAGPDFLAVNILGSPTRSDVVISSILSTQAYGTGPGGIDPGSRGAPGFNEQFYLNTHAAARQAVQAGQYATGLDHFLAVGRAQGLAAMAPGTIVRGTAGVDWITLNSGNETTFGDAGNDTIGGLAGNDVIYGGAGDDRLEGGPGNDWLDGDAGNDVIYGGDGNDSVRGLDNDDWIDGGAGADDVNGNIGNDTVYGGEGDDPWVRGGRDNDLVYGGAGNDPHVNGNIGNDTVYGEDGNDGVFGGQNEDLLYGGAGNDTLSGDLGNDTLFGGAGADVFVFRAGGGADRIADFSFADGDRIQIATGVTWTVSAAPGGEALVTLSNGVTFTMAGVAPTAVVADWFIFGA